MRLAGSIVAATLALCVCSPVAGDTGWRVIDGGLHHLRRGTTREWDAMGDASEGEALVVHFDASARATESTLRLRHRDLKLQWVVQCNGKVMAKLPQNENGMITCWAVPPGALVDGRNELRVICAASPTEVATDDVIVGDIAITDRPRAEVLAESTLNVAVTEGDLRESVPCRITIVDERGDLVDLGNASDATHAVRPGVVYAADGRARVALPAGRYTVYAGRGFAYGLARASIDAKAGGVADVALAIRKVVPLDGYVPCDTHVHTLTYSRHGDATLAERVVTLVGEGIELPIATDHNIPVDYESAARAASVRKWFTPVVGEEVTTASLGHFNVFPLAADGKPVEWRVPSWAALARKLPEGGVVILNHARDVHGGFRPFDPSRHLGVTGEDLDGWALPANAMEVVNSGATTNDPMLLVRDWFGLLNRGRFVTPIGASDSHDVSRYIVGQGRTYVRCDAPSPDRVDVAVAVRSLHEGRVLVSFGLVADLRVDDRYGPGDLAPAPDGDLHVRVRVLGPEWTKASHVTLFADGVPLREVDITTPAGKAEPAGVKWQETWVLPRPKHDVWLAAVATGPGVEGPFWPIAKPYQPTSTAWTPYVLGVSGAVRVDADGSGAFDSAHDYADRIVTANQRDLAKTIVALADYDEAVAAQAAMILCRANSQAFARDVDTAMTSASPQVKRGFEAFRADWAASGRR